MIKVRVECGDRVVEVHVSTYVEAYKAFRFAVRGQLAKNTDDLVVRFPEFRLKIRAIEALREVSGMDIANAKMCIEQRECRATDAELARRIRSAMERYAEYERERVGMLAMEVT